MPSDVKTRYVNVSKYASMEVIPLPGTAKSRKILSLGNIGNQVDFGVPDNELQTLARGILERVFFVKDPNGGHQIPPKPGKGVVERTLKQFRDRLLKRMSPTSPITPDEFVALYRGRKATIYRQAADSLVERPVVRKDSYLNTFAKDEKMNRTLKPDPVARVIQPRRPRYNVAVGVYLKPIEHDIYHAIGELFGGPVVCKGLNASQRGRLISTKWKKFKNPVAVGLDAKRFDQHVSASMLRWEHSIYNKIYHSKELAKLLSWQVHNKGFARCGNGLIKYKVEGCRMSGDMNTAMGNVIVMCAMMWTYMKQFNFKYEFVNDGDDCILIIEKRNLNKLNNLIPWFRRLGFQMEVEEPIYTLEKVPFCQSHCLLINGEYRCVRDPRVTLAKDLVCTKSIRTAREWRGHRRAVALCGLSLAGSVPVKGAFYDCLCRGTSPKDDFKTTYDMTGMLYLAVGMNDKRSEPDEDARYSFWLAFGFSPDHQKCLEKLYDSTYLKWREPPRVEVYGRYLTTVPDSPHEDPPWV